MFKMSPDVQYCFMGSLEMLEITNDVSLGLELMDVDVNMVFDEGNGHPIENLKTMYHSWYDRMATDIEKSLLGYYFILTSHYQLNNAFDLIKKQLKKSYLNIDNDNKDGDEEDEEECINEICFMLGEPEKINKISNYKTLISNKNIKEVFNDYETTKKFINNYNETYKVLTSNIKHTFQESLEYYYNKYRKKNIREYFTDDFLLDADAEFLEKNNKKENKNNKKENKEIRKIFNKSLEVLSKFIGKNEVKSFINKEEIKIEGNKYNYILKNKGDLIKNTKKMDNLHIPYILSMYNKQWEYLTQLCVVFPGSPVLDQVLSVYLMIKGNQEEELLKSANLYGEKSDLIYKEQFLIDIKKVYPRKENNIFKEIELLKLDNKKQNQTIYKIKNETFKKNEKELEKKIKNLFLKTLDVPEILKMELTMQELTFDEILDYVSVKIPLPNHLDFLIEKPIKNNFTNTLFI